MLDPERRDKGLRLLMEATRSLLRAAAEMQEKGVDTYPLTRPMEILSDTVDVLTEPDVP